MRSIVLIVLVSLIGQSHSAWAIAPGGFCGTIDHMMRRWKPHLPQGTRQCEALLTKVLPKSDAINKAIACETVDEWLASNTENWDGVMLRAAKVSNLPSDPTQQKTSLTLTNEKEFRLKVGRKFFDQGTPPREDLKHIPVSNSISSLSARGKYWRTIGDGMFLDPANPENRKLVRNVVGIVLMALKSNASNTLVVTTQVKLYDDFSSQMRTYSLVSFVNVETSKMLQVWVRSGD